MNLDPMVLEVMQEFWYFTKLGLAVPKVVVAMSSKEQHIKTLYQRLVMYNSVYNCVLLYSVLSLLF